MCAAIPANEQAILQSQLTDRQLKLLSSKELLLLQLSHLHGAHATAITAEESALIKRWRSVLDPAEWASVLLSWSRALQASGTSLTEIEDLHYRPVRLPINHSPITFIARYGAIFDLRRQLMSTQQPYMPARESSDYPYSIKPETCPLCQNIARAHDSRESAGRLPMNSILDFGSHELLPNRYPAHPGACLLLPKEHDDFSARMPIVFRGQTRTIPTHAGKTRGRIPTATDIELMIRLCDTLSFAAMRGHPLDAMSVPEHDHFHLIPAALLDRSITGALYEDPELLFVDTAGVTYARSTQSPFELLLISGPSAPATAQATQNILQHYEISNQVISLAYYDGKVILSPRRITHDQPLNLGGSINLHLITNDSPQTLLEMQNAVPLRGHFAWQTFFSSLNGSHAAQVAQ